MSELCALLFDVDGTLADTERDGHRIAFNQAFEKAGLDWHWSESLYGELLAITGGKERMLHYLKQHRPDFTYDGDVKQLVANLHASKTEFYTELLSHGSIPLREGVKRLLLEAKDQGVRLAIATTTTYDNVVALLKYTIGEEAIDWFEVIAAGDVVPAKKPAPDIYVYAMAKMHLKPEQCLAFEDSENGIRSTSGANLNTIITVNAYTQHHNFSGAAIVLSDLGEPGQPFEVITGDAMGHEFVNIAMLKQLHQQHLSSLTQAD